MMRKLLFLLLTVLVSFPTYATPLRTLVARQAHQAQQVAAPTEPQFSSRQAEIIQALQEELNAPLRQLSWEQFQQENARLGQKDTVNTQQTSAFIDELYNTDCSILTNLLKENPLHAGRPNYAKETQGTKYIFLGEHHDTDTIPAEVSFFLSTLRQAHPHANILIATEFALRINENKLPLFFSTTENTNAVWEGKQTVPFHLFAKHYEWFGEAMSYHIDVLALEDDLVYPDGQVKMGGNLVSAPIDNPQVAQIIRQYQEYVADDYTHNEAIDDFLARSDWGVKERNLQWARYIKAVSPYYDFIITYAGKGHYIGSTTGVPALVSPEHYVQFDFFADEEIPQTSMQVYEGCGKVQEEQNARSSAELSLSDEQRDFIRQLRANTLPPTRNIIYYRKREAVRWDEYDHRELNRLSQQYFQQNWGDIDNSQAVLFTVYLPDITPRKYKQTVDDWLENLAWKHECVQYIRAPEKQKRYQELLEQLENSVQQIVQDQELSLRERTKQLNLLYLTARPIEEEMHNLFMQE